MPFSLGSLAPHIRFADVLDVLIISVLLYFVFLWVRRKASRPVAVGIIAISLAYFLADGLRMYLTSWVFRAGLTALLVAVVLLLQEDIRRAFEQLSTFGMIRSRRRRISSTQSIDELLKAISTMSRELVGALIVIKGREELERHLRGGISLNGRITDELIRSIFFPKTPGHDGALIIDGDRIEKFKAQLPLSTDMEQIKNRGTRHSAALGLSEHSDAFIIVVSEERGSVSIAENGMLRQVDAMPALKERLERFYAARFPSAATGRRFPAWIEENTGLKALALVVAAGMWFFMANKVDTVSRTYTAPIQYRNLPKSWVIENTRQTEARVSLTGTERAFVFDPSILLVSVDLAKVLPGAHDYPIDQKSVSVPRGLRVTQVQPRTVRVDAQRMVELERPVRVIQSGALPPETTLDEVKAQPPSVRVLVRQSSTERIGPIRTEPLQLESIRQSTTVRLRLMLPDSVQLAPNQPGDVRVSVEVKKAPAPAPDTK